MKNARIMGVAVAAVMALSLTACGGNNAAADKDAESAGSVSVDTSEPVTLRMTWWGGDGRHERTQEALDLFQEKYPNIKVEPEFSDWSGYWDKLATSTAGGNAPDVIQMDQVYLASYAERGTLADLSALSGIDTSGINPSVLDMGKTDGGLYGLPISVTGLGVLVNLDKLQELGIEVPDANTWTWDDYGAWTKSITDASGGKVYGSSIGWIEFQLQLFARQNGDQLFDAGNIVIKPETLEKFFQYNLDWVESGAAPNGTVLAERINLPTDQLDFSIGNAATIFVPSTTITTYTKAMNDANLALLKLPANAGTSSGWEYLKPGMYWSASAKSEHPEEAALLINFMVNDPDAAKILGVERGIPSNSSALDAVRDTLTESELKAVDFAESLELGPAPSIVPNGASEIQDVLQRYALEVVLGSKTPAEAAAALIAEIETSIESS